MSKKSISNEDFESLTCSLTPEELRKLALGCYNLKAETVMLRLARLLEEYQGQDAEPVLRSDGSYDVTIRSTLFGYRDPDNPQRFLDLINAAELSLGYNSGVARLLRCLQIEVTKQAPKVPEPDDFGAMVSAGWNGGDGARQRWVSPVSTMNLTGHRTWIGENGQRRHWSELRLPVVLSK